MSLSLKRKRFHKTKYGRCPNGHRYCSDCRTKHGRNFGNRSERHRVKILLHVNRYP